MQKILPRGEIETLESTEIPRVRLANRADVFLDRAARLRQIAAGNPLEGYLLLLAELVTAQHHALQTANFALPSDAAIDLAFGHAMPIIPASAGPHDASWTSLIQTLVAHMLKTQMPDAAVQTCERLLNMTEAQIHTQVLALLDNHASDKVDAATAPFMMAALQVYWTDMSSRLNPKKDIPLGVAAGNCPVCGSLPVSSVIHISGAYLGHRYLHCSLCNTQWHMVRIKCTQCESTEGIHYHSIESGSEAIKAESCSSCHSYRKIFYLEKDYGCDPIADDLGSMMLDLLMGDEGFHRASGNPFLWSLGAE